MPRGYRCILVALVGWLTLAAAQPENATEQPNAATQADVSGSLHNIASALQDANKASAHDKPCDQGGDDRSSDLCAQWKAADAAASSAKATWVFGYVGTLIGLLTLGAAGAAAWYAREAARHTKTGADEARRAANAAEQELENTRHAVRAYLQSEKEAVAWVSGKLILNMILRNTGSTPAHGVVGTFTAVYNGAGKVRVIRRWGWRNGTTAPGGIVDLELDIALEEPQAKALEEDRAAVYVTLDAEYVNAFDERWTYTHNLTIRSRALKTGVAGTDDCKQLRKPPEEDASHQPSLDLKDGQ